MIDVSIYRSDGPGPTWRFGTISIHNLSIRKTKLVKKKSLIARIHTTLIRNNLMIV